MYLTILILPLLGSILSGLFGRKLGWKGSQLITIILLIITSILSIILFYEIAILNNVIYINLGNWINIDYLEIDWSLKFDALTTSMYLAVILVSLSVHIFSVGYMQNDPHLPRFFSYLSLFTYFMIILVTANNLLILFIGWEFIGICSYLLIGYWFTWSEANSSALSAILYNRFGDYALTVGYFIIINTFLSLNYDTIFSLSYLINENIIFFIGICLLIGSSAKSAQLGLHAWLPQAMTGPTPVSALIHAATLVTAGCYLLIRMSPLIEYSNNLLLIIFWLGSLTALFAGLNGLFANDIKKIIAYSTMSQLGYIVAGIGCSIYIISLYHLINHAFFKAALFMSAGAVIHSMEDNQSIRKYGGLANLLPLSNIVILIASLSLMAFPYLSGFYSKELIILSSRGYFTLEGNTIYLILNLAAMLTTFYSFKLYYYTFLSKPNFNFNLINNIHESNLFIAIPLILLSIFSIFSGYLLNDIFIGFGNNIFNDIIFIHPNHNSILDTEFSINIFYKLLPLILTICSIILSYIIYELYININIIYLINNSNTGYNNNKFNIFNKVKYKFLKIYVIIYKFFNQKLYYDLIINQLLIFNVLYIGYIYNKVLDRGSLEYIGPTGLYKLFMNISYNYHIYFDNKSITNYSLYIGLSTLVYLVIIIS